MNSTRISKLILSLLFLCLATTGRAQTFPRLLLGGDYPDPSIIREGKDFYMTNSSFNYAPGLLVWHSTDLVNWTPIARALHALDGSVYAPDLVKYKGRYYIYYRCRSQLCGLCRQYPRPVEPTGETRPDGHRPRTCSGRRRQAIFICGQRCHSPAKR